MQTHLNKRLITILLFFLNRIMIKQKQNQIPKTLIPTHQKSTNMN